MEDIFRIREELAKIIIDYDKKVKHNFEIEARYNMAFKEEVPKLLVFESQEELLKLAISSFEEGKSLEEIDKLVNQVRIKNVNRIINRQKKAASFNNIVKNLEKYSNSDRESLQKHYEDLVIKFHPALTLMPGDHIKQQFAMIREYYIQGNIEGLMQFAKDLDLGSFDKNGLTTEEIKTNIDIAYKEFSRESERVAKYDKQFAELEEIVDDEMLLARNEARIRERLYAAKQSIVALTDKANAIFEGKIDLNLISNK